MKLEKIGFYTLSDLRCKNASHLSPIYRAEILLTDACNFKCPYCRGPSKEYKGCMSVNKTLAIINYLVGQKIINIRFSGGEPTLYDSLSDIVSYCKSNGIKRIAVSTNGSADLDYYKILINEGVNDFSVSLDACCASTAQTMAGGVDMWHKVINNIKELSKLTYVTVGIVFDEKNVTSIKNTIEFAHNLGVSDIRIIPSAQYNNSKVFKQFKFNFLDKHPILKYRINNFNMGKNIRGLTEKDNKRCPLVLDDIAFAGNYHYPCIIYLREHGKPIGSLNNLNNIRIDRFNWYMSHNCQEDKICKKNCLDVCIEYNNQYKD